MKCSIILTALLLLPVSAFAQGISDAEIAAIVVTANHVDIDAGKLALARSSNDQVRAFAQLMIIDHSGVNKTATELITRLKVTPRDNPTSQRLKATGEMSLTHLKALSGAAFDYLYINREFLYHQYVIDALDKTLIPGATNAELKALLIKVRPAFIAHRDHAKSLQSSTKRSRVHATTEPQRNVTPDITIHVWGVASGDFDTRMTTYATLRDRLQQGLPPLRITDDPEDIRRAEHALARRIRAARSGAHGGEIFTAEITAAFKDALVLETRPSVCAAILDDNPGRFSYDINDTYPKRRPLSSVPPGILTLLPRLPADVYYRFLGRELILHDTRANVILDRIPDAIRCHEVK